MSLLILSAVLALTPQARPEKTSFLDRFEAKDIPEKRRFPNMSKDIVAVLLEPTQFPAGETARCIDLNADGILANLEGTWISLWDLKEKTPTTRGKIEGLTGYPELKYSRDGKLAVSGMQTILWDVTGAQPRPHLTLDCTPYNCVTGLTFSTDGKRLAGSAFDGHAVVWDISKEKPQPLHAMKHPTSIYVSAFSPDGRLLACGLKREKFSLWDISGKEPRLLTDIPHPYSIGHLQFTPDGKTLVVGDCSVSTLYLVDVTAEGMKKRGTLDGHAWDSDNPKSIRGMALLPDGKSLVTLASSYYENLPRNDGEIFLWDLETRRKKAEWRLPAPVQYHGMTLAPDGRHVLVVNGSGLIYVIRLATAGKG